MKSSKTSKSNFWPICIIQFRILYFVMNDCFIVFKKENEHEKFFEKTV